MFIRIGFELTIDCPQPTPMILALNTYPANNRRMIGSDHIHVEPDTAVGTYTDIFGNLCTRLEVGPGKTMLWSDCMVEDSGEPDPYDWNARQREIRVKHQTLTVDKQQLEHSLNVLDVHPHLDPVEDV